MEPADEAAIGRLIADFYSAFDNRGGRAPRLERLLEIVSPDARIVRVSPDGAESWSLQSFLEPRIALLTDGALTEFHEWEVAGITFGGGAIACRWSDYEKSGTTDGAEFHGAGRKLIQMLKENGRWWICSILWEDLTSP